jgi:hypothetical protein
MRTYNDPRHFDFIPEAALKALKPLERKDYIIWESVPEWAYPLATLRDVLKLAGEFALAAEISAEGVLNLTDTAGPVKSRTHLIGTSTSRAAPKYDPRGEWEYEYAPFNATPPVLVMWSQSAPAAVELDAWIGKARANGRKETRQRLVEHWGNFCADGFRLHYDPTAAPRAFEYPDGSELPHFQSMRATVERIRQDAQRTARNLATVTGARLYWAVKGAKAINKDTIRLSFNGRLEVTADSGYIGSNLNSAASFPIEAGTGYNYAGPDTVIGLDPRFILDALSGMEAEEIMIGFGRPDQPVIITDGRREAVIMTKHLEAA